MRNITELVIGVGSMIPVAKLQKGTQCLSVVSFRLGIPANLLCQPAELIIGMADLEALAERAPDIKGFLKISPCLCVSSMF
jgi:hypothetical protein